MTFPLNDIAVELKRMVFQKCSARSLCRLRRANKAIDEIVEENRNQISARSDNAPLTLRFRIAYNNENLILRIEALKEWFFWNDFFILKIQEIPEERFHLITNPYKQLSAIYINTVYFHADHFTRRYRIVMSTPEHIAHEIEETALNEQRILLHSEILPVIQRLRLHSERLSIFELPSALVSEILHVLRGISKIYLDTQIYSTDAVSLPLENVVERFYRGFMDIPSSITPLVAGASNVDIQFYHENMDHLLIKFLEDLRQGRENLGILEFISFRNQVEGERDINESLGSCERIWEGIICNFPGLGRYYMTESSAYTMRLAEGTAVIFTQKKSYYQVYFVAEATREVLFQLVSSWIFTLGAYDLSGLYDEFMAIENLSEAFTTIYGRYFS